MVQTLKDFENSENSLQKKASKLILDVSHIEGPFKDVSINHL